MPRGSFSFLPPVYSVDRLLTPSELGGVRGGGRPPTFESPLFLTASSAPSFSFCTSASVPPSLWDISCTIFGTFWTCSTCGVLLVCHRRFLENDYLLRLHKTHIQPRAALYKSLRLVAPVSTKSIQISIQTAPKRVGFPAFSV